MTSELENFDELVSKIYEAALSPQEWTQLLQPINEWVHAKTQTQIESEPYPAKPYPAGSSIDLDATDKSLPPTVHVEKLIAHLERAVKTGHQMHKLEDTGRLLNETYDHMPWPLLILDSEAEVISSNPIAQRNLIDSFPVQISAANKLVIRDKKLAQELQEVLSLKRGRDRQLLSSPLDQVVLLCLPLQKSVTAIDTARISTAVWVLSNRLAVIPAATALQSTFGLTKSEARLLHTLCKVGDLAKSAELLSITKSTARSYLKIIKNKMGVSTQAELVSQTMSHSLIESLNVNAPSLLTENLEQEWVLTLPDGRILSWYEYGSPEGRPVLVLENHGCTMPCHAPHQQWYLENNIRVIVVIRPGYGISSENHDAPFKDFAHDLKILLDHLDLNKLVLAANCLGGAFGLTTAAQYPALFSKIGILGSVVPPEFMRVDLMDSIDRHFYTLYKKDKRIFSMVIRLAVRAGNLAPRQFYTRIGKSFGGRDQELLNTPEIVDMLAVQHKLRFCQGGNVYAEDQMKILEPWDIDFQSLKLPITFWHGEQDPIFHVSTVREFCESLPNANIKTFPNYGHFLQWDCWRDYLSHLLKD